MLLLLSPKNRLLLALLQHWSSAKPSRTSKVDATDTTAFHNSTYYHPNSGAVPVQCDEPCDDWCGRLRLFGFR